MHVNSNNYIKFKGILLTSMHCFICGEKISSHERKNWLFCTKCEQQLQPEDRAKLNRLKWLAILNCAVSPSGYVLWIKISGNETTRKFCRRD